jgi:hypothetical protein
MIKVGDIFIADNEEWRVTEINDDWKAIFLFDEYYLNKITVYIGEGYYKSSHDTWNDEWFDNDLSEEEIIMVNNITKMFVEE